MHEGSDKNALPRNWQIYNKAKYQMVTHLFQEYLTTCYSKFYASTYLKSLIHNRSLAQEEHDTHKLPLELDGLISMEDELPFDVPEEIERVEAMEKSSRAWQKVETATGDKKGKAKKHRESPNVSSTEQSEDDSSGTEDGNGVEYNQSIGVYLVAYISP